MTTLAACLPARLPAALVSRQVSADLWSVPLPPPSSPSIRFLGRKQHHVRALKSSITFVLERD